MAPVMSLLSSSLPQTPSQTLAALAGLGASAWLLRLIVRHILLRSPARPSSKSPSSVGPHFAAMSPDTQRALQDRPVLIVGGGLAGLVAAFELSERGVPTIILDQENDANLGGQAFWSLGGIFCVDSTEQRRMGIKDSRELAMRDWFGSAQFDRETEDTWPRRWAEAFVNFAADEMEAYVKARGMGFLFNSSREVVGDFEIFGSAVAVTSGGIGGNVDAVKAAWPIDRLGPKVPETFVVGVPAHVDGRMIGIAEQHICATGYDYSWFILDQSIIAREFALSGSEQNPDVTGKSVWKLLTRVFGKKGTVPVQNFQKHGKDFVVRDNLPELVQGMNELQRERGGPVLDLDDIRETIELRDGQFDNAYSKDAQAMLINNGRTYWADKRSRIAVPHKLLDKAHGPLIAVRMNLLTRKTLGGIETNLESNVMKANGEKFPGLYAAGEAAGFGGGGVHGYNSLEGTFLGGCIFSGRAAGRGIADELLGPAEAKGVRSKM
ncbi:FAD binding domain-containing protein [Colletotrichum asianum]